MDHTAPSRSDPEGHQRGAAKLARIPVKVAPTTELVRKPDWIRTRVSTNPRVQEIKQMMRELKLSSVCEEASCPNLGECFSHGTATFMIMGDICTRRCPFCDVAHGKPNPLDTDEPANLAKAVAQLGLKYIVITSVDRDDLRDGGASHFDACIRAVREACPGIQIEVLVPDYRGRMEKALEGMSSNPPDVFNHNLETVPRLYRQCRPGSDYEWSLDLLENHKKRFPHVPTKSGLMLGLGETMEEVLAVMQDLRDHQVDMLTLGQYLQPSRSHLPVSRFWHPTEFDELARLGDEMGFSHVASGPMVRSSYHADRQAANVVTQ
ncbi:lipoyl synthase [Granulosicoccus sp. 3-233]|uniref:lipoyl synthase n=1 Tax=Granulosicoccus sp. 3-233 TaxID=3417969 RepID=UPI003D3509D7